VLLIDKVLLLNVVDVMMVVVMVAGGVQGKQKTFFVRNVGQV
jgi:hypothetical protein